MGKVIYFPKIQIKPPVSKIDVLTMSNSVLEINELLKKRAERIKNQLPEPERYLISDYLNFVNIVFDQLIKISPSIDVKATDVEMYLDALSNQWDSIKLGLQFDVEYSQKLINSVVDEIHAAVMRLPNE